MYEGEHGLGSGRSGGRSVAERASIEVTVQRVGNLSSHPHPYTLAWTFGRVAGSTQPRVAADGTVTFDEAFTLQYASTAWDKVPLQLQLYEGVEPARQLRASTAFNLQSFIETGAMNIVYTKDFDAPNDELYLQFQVQQKFAHSSPSFGTEYESVGESRPSTAVTAVTPRFRAARFPRRQMSKRSSSSSSDDVGATAPRRSASRASPRAQAGESFSSLEPAAQQQQQQKDRAAAAAAGGDPNNWRCYSVDDTESLWRQGGPNSARSQARHTVVSSVSSTGLRYGVSAPTSPAEDGSSHDLPTPSPPPPPQPILAKWDLDTPTTSTTNTTGMNATARRGTPTGDQQCCSCHCVVS